MHRAHWHADNVQKLWSGESLFRTDDDTLLSHELARIIVEQMSRQWDRFVDFVRAAAEGAATRRSLFTAMPLSSQRGSRRCDNALCVSSCAMTGSMTCRCARNTTSAGNPHR